MPPLGLRASDRREATLDADVETIFGRVQLPAAAESHDDGAQRAERRAELQAALAAEQISLEAFTRAWKALSRPHPLARDPDREALETARVYLADFGSLWRDPDVPGELKEEAAREIFEQLDVLGDRLVAVHPRAEHAWLLGMEAKKREDLVLVGARGFEPPTPWPPAKCAARLRHAPTERPV